MYIAKILKRLRLEKGLTQEDIAGRIGVTGQAVSKWERDECYPDITLLPGLANLFNVTVDELLGMKEINDRENLWRTKGQANSLQIQGKYHDAATILEQAIKVFPSDISLLAAHATTLAMSGEGIDRAIEMCERVLAEDYSDKYRSSVSAVLCYLYYCIGMTEKAVQLARSRPHARESRELLMPNFMTQPERNAYLHENLPGILTDICALIEGRTRTIEEQLRLIELGTYNDFIDPTDAMQIITDFFIEKQ